VAAPLGRTLRVADFAPADVGVNITLIVHADPAWTEVPQLLICENWFALGPPNEMLVSGSATLAELVTVTVWAAVGTFVCSVPKGMVAGLTEKLDATPVPVRATAWVPAVPPFTLMLADFAPTDVGLNTTLIVHVAPTATVVPQLFVCENWFALVPLTLMLVMDTVEVPVLVNVTATGVVATFNAWLPKGTAIGVSVNAGAATDTV
jgi:hypothetical protein